MKADPSYLLSPVGRGFFRLNTLGPPSLLPNLVHLPNSGLVCS
mgnify:CR=1 FL=1